MSLLLRVAFCVLAFLLWVPGAWAAEKLTILHTNDTHSHLVPFDTSAEGTDIGGIARRGVFFRKVRAEQPNTLIMDAGDIFQGTPVYTFFHGEPEMKAMDQIGYDLATMGNHDLDNGLENLRAQLQHIHFPFLCANVLGPDGKPIFQPWTVVARGKTRVAVVGMLGRGAWDVVSEKNKPGLRFVEPKGVLKELIPELRKQAELLVVVTHQGWQEDQDMVKDLPGVDVVVGGHSHTRPKDDKAVLVANGSDNGIGGTIVLQAFQWGVFVGKLDLSVEGSKIASWSWELVPIDAKYNPPADDLVTKTVAVYEDKIKAAMEEEIGEAASLMSNKGSRAGENALGDWVADVLRERARADIAIINAGGLREELPAGPVTVGRIFSILPFDNALTTLKMKGRDVLQVLQRIADSRNKSGFMQVSGLQFHVRNGKVTEVRVGPRLGKAAVTTPPPAPTPVPAAAPQRLVVVTKDQVNVRSAPTLQAPLLGLRRRGERLPMLGFGPRQEWVKVRLTDGRAGWMSVQYVQVMTSKAAPAPAGRPARRAAPPSPYEALDPNKTYTVATIDFLVHLTRGQEGGLFARGTDIKESTQWVRDIVTEHVRQRKRVEPPPLNRMFFH